MKKIYIMKWVRNSRAVKSFSAFFAIVFLGEIVFPTAAWALTSGPSQPEVQSFEPVGTTDMVDLFTGDFNYNIPLFELPGPNGGYPFNIAYHSGVGMDQEASWVGLGWNLNPGALVREMRGLPDEFDGANDKVIKRLDMKNNITFGLGMPGDLEIFGAPLSSVGPTFYYNNFKGVGYSLQAGLGWKASDQVNLGLGLSLDSQEGAGVSPNLSYNTTNNNGPNKYSLGLGFNSRSGASLQLSASNQTNKHYTITAKDGSQTTGTRGVSGGGGSALSFSSGAYSPIVSNQIISSNLNISLKAGGDMGGVFTDINQSGFYKQDRLHKKNKAVTYSAYGYNHLEDYTNANASSTDHLMADFNREKDGAVTKYSPNLAIPNLTYDIYTIQGQGTGGMFRPYRSEVGRIEDPFVRSWGAGGAVGLEIGLGQPIHVGVDFNINYSSSVSKPWDEDNDWYNTYEFRSFSEPAPADAENVYFKVHGEYTSFDMDEMEDIGNESPVAAQLEKQSGFIRKYVPQNNPSQLVQDRFSRPRMPRNNTVFPVTNLLLQKDELQNYSPVLGEYKIKYYSAPTAGNYVSSNAVSLGRSQSYMKPMHYAGFTTLNQDGNRYVYALPVYNKKSAETLFSVEKEQDLCTQTTQIDIANNEPDYKVPNTNNFFNRTEIGSYVHSYMLTSVLGADYVDLSNDGPTDDDLGYWVKFNYAKVADTYKWRAPYTNANYNKGAESMNSDDLASVAYGEREMYNIATAETKTHIAVFHVSNRNDAMDAYAEYAQTGTRINSKKLDAVTLYSKEEYKKFEANTSYVPVCIKEVHFDYTYDLCGHVQNNGGSANGVNANQGKLTLKKIWFTYQNNQRGALSPYIFDYHERHISDGSVNYDENPDYDITKYDRWGNYRPNNFVSSSCALDHPYTPQFNSDEVQSTSHKENFKSFMDNAASVWSLKEITLPSGSIMKIEYEADDYGYVQHRKAGQMFNISGTGQGGEENNLLYNKDAWDKNDEDLRKLFFKLETPIPTDLGSTTCNALFKKEYLDELYSDGDGGKQLYFKAHVNLKAGIHDYVSGYANIDMSTPGTTYGVTNVKGIADGLDEDCYTEGFIVLKLPPKVNGKDINYHPISVAAWQYMRTQNPDMFLQGVNVVYKEAGVGTKQEKVNTVLGIKAWSSDVSKIFNGYRKFAFNEGYAGQIDLNNSFIRLSTPDSKKIGGGVRVKRIIIDDKWSSSTNNQESSSEYGQVYDYTQVLKNEVTGENEVVSSGVAQYEPLIGGDEINLRHAKNYTQKIFTMTDNNLFFEHPVNESYFPGPVVGYSKVTVQSLATSKSTVPAKAKTGFTEHEFYTAKEFPVIVSETAIDIPKFDLFIPIPLIGQLTWKYLTGSQGYAIQLNDMHGKLKSIKYFSNDTQGNKAALESSVQYDYSSEVAFVDEDGREVKKLNNELPVLSAETIDVNGKMVSNEDTKLIGEEYEIFTDQRHTKSIAFNGGINFNAEIFLIAGIPCPWPTFSMSDVDLRTVVTNKVIHKTGILLKTIATDGSSTVVTENKKFDSMTGRPLLTTVTNNFEDPIYNYDMPAQWSHENMGPAYKNIGFTFYAKVASPNTSNNTFTISNIQAKHSSTTLTLENLYDNFLNEGDELVIGKQDGALFESKQKATLIEKRKSCVSSTVQKELIFHADDIGLSAYSSTDLLKFTVVRSGKRNQLSINEGNINGLIDPSNNDNRNTETHSSSSIGVEAIIGELAQFLNDHLVGGNLTIGTYYDLSKYPILFSMFLNLTISTYDCSMCDESVNTGYKLSGKLKDGNCSNFICSCIAPYIEGEINSFAANGPLLVTTYWGDSNCSKDISECFNFPDQKLTYLTNIIKASAVNYSNHWEYEKRECDNAFYPPYNMYASGIKGTWRPYKDNYYKDERWKNTTETSAAIKLKEDGVYDGDGTNKHYYLYNWNPTLQYPIPQQWISNNFYTKYNANGFDVENRDILGVYSAALYGYRDNLPVAVASNAKKEELYFESFDDPSSCPFYNDLPSGLSLTNLFPHTGKTSLYCPIATTGSVQHVETNSSLTGGEYVFSAWVGSPVPSKHISYNYENDGNSSTLSPSITLTFLNSTGTAIGSSPVFLPNTGEKIINGWQRMETAVTVPAGVAQIKLAFSGSIGTDRGGCYFDDIRIFPADAGMKTFVYDPVTYRLSATLDDNNYASMYYYDESGKLFLTKRETINGIKTINESREHVKE